MACQVAQIRRFSQDIVLVPYLGFQTGYPLSSLGGKMVPMSESRQLPVAGQDYPKTWSQFMDWFHTEQACLDYLQKLRWPKEFICPKCGVISAPIKTSRNRLVCQSCKHQASVTAGTIFDKTRTPLKVWLAAAWYITNQKQGVSALGLQRVLGLGSYQTAWAMLHRFRRAMIRPGRDLLNGLVEVDETFIAIGDKAQPANAKGRKSQYNQNPCGYRRGDARTQRIWAHSLASHFR